MAKQVPTVRVSLTLETTSTDELLLRARGLPNVRILQREDGGAAILFALSSISTLDTEQRQVEFEVALLAQLARLRDLGIGPVLPTDSSLIVLVHISLSNENSQVGVTLDSVVAHALRDLRAVISIDAF